MATSKELNKRPHDVESLVDVFRCFICMEKLQDARLCPHCSKLCCYPCIRRWLSEQHSHCPHCRATLHLNELVNCRWAEDVTLHLNNMQQNAAITPINDSAPQRDICSEHNNEKLSVYCCTCQMCICHQCALWAGKHIGHDFKPLDEVYSNHLQRITEEISLMQGRQIELIGVIQEVERNVEAVKKAKDERVVEIRKVVEMMISRLENQHHSKRCKLTDLRHILMSEMDDLEQLFQWTELKKRNCSKEQLIATSADIFEKIKKANRKPVASFVSAPIPSDFISEIVPQFETSTFMMTNFTTAQQLGVPVYSPPLNVYGLVWKLKVYPDGNGIVRGKFLSIFLELTEGSPESSEFEYRLEMVHPTNDDDSRNIVREFSSDFEVGDCWGYNRFSQLSQLLTDGYLNVETDTLVLRFYVRSPTYFQKSRDQQLYISKLKASLKTERNHNKNLQNKLKEKSSHHIPCRHGLSCCKDNKMLQPSRCRVNNTMEDLMLINIDMEAEIQNKPKNQPEEAELIESNDHAITYEDIDHAITYDSSSFDEVEETDSSSIEEENLEGVEDQEEISNDLNTNLNSGSLSDSDEQDLKHDDEQDNWDSILQTTYVPLNVSLDIETDISTPSKSITTSASSTAHTITPVTPVSHQKRTIRKMFNNRVKSYNRDVKEKHAKKWCYPENLFLHPTLKVEKMMNGCKASKSDSNLPSSSFVRSIHHQAEFTIPSIDQCSTNDMLQKEISQKMNKYCIINPKNVTSQSAREFAISNDQKREFSFKNLLEEVQSSKPFELPSAKSYNLHIELPSKPTFNSTKKNDTGIDNFFKRNEEAGNDADEDDD